MEHWARTMKGLAATAARLWIVLGVAGLCGACRSDSQPTSTGGLVVIVESDLALPADIDRITVEATQVNSTLLHEDRKAGPGKLLIPAEFAIGPTGNSVPVVVHAVAYKGTSPRVERTAVTPIPVDHVGVLHIPLNYLCDGTAKEDGTSSCGNSKTCKQGTCATSTVSPSEVAEKPAMINAADAGKVASSGCLDVLGCFATATVVDVDPTTCSLHLPMSIDVGHVTWPSRCRLPRTVAATALVASLRSNRAPKVGRWSEATSCSRPARVSRAPMGILRWSLLPRLVPPRRRAPQSVARGRRPLRPSISRRPRSPWATPATALRVKSAAIAASRHASVKTGPGRVGEPVRERGLVLPARQSLVEWRGREPVPIVANGALAATRPARARANRLVAIVAPSAADVTPRRASQPSGDLARAKGPVHPTPIRTCPTGGSQTCGGSCQWGECTEHVCPGSAEQGCGNCGTQKRTCDSATGTWSAWSACSSEGVCQPNAARSCGTGERRCAAESANGVRAEANLVPAWHLKAVANAAPKRAAAITTPGRGRPGQRAAAKARVLPMPRAHAAARGPKPATRVANGIPRAPCNSATGRPQSRAETADCEPALATATRACGQRGLRAAARDLANRPLLACVAAEGPKAAPRVANGRPPAPDKPAQARARKPAETAAREHAFATTIRASGQRGPRAVPRELASQPIPACVATEAPNSATRVANGIPLARVKPAWARFSKAAEIAAPKTESATPTRGSLAAWSACAGQGACSPTAVQSCGTNSTQTCTAQCAWGTCGCANGFQICGGACVNEQTDSQNCGSCGNVCLPGSTCSRGCLHLRNERVRHGGRHGHQALRNRGERRQRVREQPLRGAIVRAPISGGAPVNVVTGQSFGSVATDIAVGGGYVFWSTGGTLRQAAEDGSGITSLANAEVTTISMVSSDGVNAYYMTNYNIVKRVPVGGGLRFRYQRAPSTATFKTWCSMGVRCTGPTTASTPPITALKCPTRRTSTKPRQPRPSAVPSFRASISRNIKSPLTELTCSGTTAVCIASA